MGRSGYFKKNLSGWMAYDSFCPSNLLPTPPIEIDHELDQLMRTAYFEVGKLWGLSMLIPNKSLFISMYVRKEALLSSQIEGTQATLDDIFDPHASASNQDVEEVIKYIDALKFAFELHQELPLSIRFIKQVHSVLLSSQRGKEKDPGELRKTQNWIGPNGSTIKTATFIPPNLEDMKAGLDNLELFIHDLSDVDPLIKIALIHYQFETLHPFLDGNGRIGRLLITLLLKQYGLLDDGVLYLSYFLKKNRMEYYDRLMDVRLKGHYEAWIKFFIRGMVETAIHATNCMKKLIDLKTHNMDLIAQLDSRLASGILQLFEYIESHPIIDIHKAATSLNKSYNTIDSYVKKMIHLGILREVTNKQRNRLFVYHEYLNILRDES